MSGYEDRTRYHGLIQILIEEGREKRKEKVPDEVVIAFTIMAAMPETIKDSLNQEMAVKAAEFIGMDAAKPEVKDGLARAILLKARDIEAADPVGAVEMACRSIVAGNDPLVPAQAEAVKFVAQRLPMLAERAPQHAPTAAQILQLHAPEMEEREIGSRYLFRRMKDQFKSRKWEDAFTAAAEIMMGSRNPQTSAEKQTIAHLEESLDTHARKAPHLYPNIGGMLMQYTPHLSPGWTKGAHAINAGFKAWKEMGNVNNAAMTARVMIQNGIRPETQAFKDLSDYLVRTRHQQSDQSRGVTDLTLRDAFQGIDTVARTRKVAREQMISRTMPALIFVDKSPTELIDLLKSVLGERELQRFDPKGAKPN